MGAFVWFEGLLVFPLVFSFLGMVFKNSLFSSPLSHFLPFSHFFLSFSTFGVSSIFFELEFLSLGVLEVRFSLPFLFLSL